MIGLCMQLSVLTAVIFIVDATYNFPNQTVPQSSFGSKFVVSDLLNPEKPNDDGIFSDGPVVGDTVSVGLTSVGKSQTSDDSDAITGVEFTPQITPNTSEIDAYLYAKNNQASSGSQKSIPGTLFAVNNITVEDMTIDANSQNNIGTTEQGRAVSGTQNLFQETDGSDVDITNNAQNNFASATGDDAQDAISGTSNSFGAVRNGQIVIDEVSKNNTADAPYADVGTRQVISGSVFGAQELDNSVVELTRQSEDNVARGGSGSVVAGTQNNFQVSESQVSIDDTNKGNKAYGGERANSIAGTQTNIGESTNSTLDIQIDNSDNFASNNNTNNQTRVTIAGSQTNLGILDNSNTSVNIMNTNNNATSVNGTAISGSQLNAGEIINSDDVDLSFISKDNKATTVGDKAVISGVQNNIGKIENSDVIINNTASGNKAFVSGGSGDAIAGTDTFIGRVYDSSVNVYNYAYNNYALADTGDAVAGSRLIVASEDNQSEINPKFYYAGNTANTTDTNGNIIIQQQSNL